MFVIFFCLFLRIQNVLNVYAQNECNVNNLWHLVCGREFSGEEDQCMSVNFILVLYSEEIEQCLWSSSAVWVVKVTSFFLHINSLFKLT